MLRADLISSEARALLASVARVVLVGQRGSLADQLDRVPEPEELARTSRKPAMAAACDVQAAPPPPLEFFNGLGGFAEDGREYVTILGPGQATPAPWINVIANPAFGFQVATEGSGYTWSVNSRENQLTPWSNDPVSDRPGEVFYLRDDDTGELWCPTALPIRDDTATYVARHGWGYSRFEHAVARHRRRTAAVRSARRSDQDLAPDAAQYVAPHAAAVGDRLCRMGAWSVARCRRAVRDDCDRSRHRRDVRAQSMERRLRIARRLRRSCWAPDATGRATGGSSSAATAHWSSPAALAGAAPLSNTGRRRSRSVRRAADDRRSSPPNARVEIVFFLGEAAERARRSGP